MAVHAEVVLRVRLCSHSACRALFMICTCCDRGQRYCSQLCRDRARRRQHRAANRRHQSSPEGRLDHRDRQKRYRRCHGQKSVTDQGSPAVVLPSPSKREEVIQRPAVSRLRLPACARPVFEPCCIVCGRRGRLLDPFPRISTRR